MVRLVRLLSVVREAIGLYWQKLVTVLSYPKTRKVTVAAALLYIFLFLILIGDITYASRLAQDAPSLQIVEDWTERIFRQKISFNYEPVAALYVTRNLVFLISPVNLALGAVLAVLIGLNIGFLAFALEKPKVCGAKSYGGVVASVPGLFLGFACCAPTILIALGSAAASISFGFLAIRSVFYPIAFFGLLLSLWYNLKRMKLGRKS